MAFVFFDSQPEEMHPNAPQSARISAKQAEVTLADCLRKNGLDPSAQKYVSWPHDDEDPTGILASLVEDDDVLVVLGKRARSILALYKLQGGVFLAKANSVRFVSAPETYEPYVRETLGL